MARSKNLDLVVLILLVALASAISLYFRTTFLPSTLLFLGLPSLYLAVRLKRRTQWKRIATMALVFGVWYGWILAYIADWNRIWAWPTASLSWGWFLGVNPVEWLWVLFWVLFIVLFYEHFMERDTASRLSSRLVWAVAPAALVSFVILALTIWYPALLTWPYAYAVCAALALPPALFLLVRNPRILAKLALPGLFFIPLHITHEITSLILGQWYFPGQYFYMVPLLAGTRVPIEEFFVWIVFGSFIVLAYYELYVDDGI